MKQLIEEMKTGRVRSVETSEPRCGTRDVLVRNQASVISPGTEKMLIEMGKKSLLGKALARPDLVSLAYQKARREGFLGVFREALARLDEPMPLGYSSAGVVIETGKDVREFRVGDFVACAGFGSASHAGVIVVPEDLCTLVPEKDEGGTPITPEEAAFVMIGGIALQGIRCAQLSPGENVVVVGLGLIGLLTVQLAKAYGSTTVGVDIDRKKVQLAKALGCDHGLVLGRDDVESAVLNATDGQGTDAVLLTAATKDNSPILLAERVARKRGRIVLVGVSDIVLTRKAFWDKELTFTVSKSSGPYAEPPAVHRSFQRDVIRWPEKRNHEEFVRLLALSRVRVKEMITHRYPLDKALDAYSMILRGKEPYIGVVISYPDEIRRERVVRRAAAQAPDPSVREAPRSGVGVIGAGMFTKNILLPAARTLDGIKFVGISGKTGLGATHLAEKFDFAYSGSDYTRILDDPQVGSVLITTRHNLHAGLIVESLSAGKHVFVEKPLCLTEKEVDSIIHAFNSGPRGRMFMVGFNRRFSPLTRTLSEWLAQRTSPMQIQYRVNASYIPPDHWTQNPDIGGGRIVGEGCHFIDFMQYLTGADPQEVFAYSIGGNTGRFLRDDNAVISLRLSDGSVASLTYTALGSKTFSRERIEVYCEESVAVLDDFRTLTYVKGATTRKRKLRRQDMGYAAELEHFFHGDVARGADFLRSAALTTLTTLGAVESLRTGRPVTIRRIGAVQ